MDHQGAPNGNLHHYTLKKSDLAKNWPSSGPRLCQISTFAYLWPTKMGKKRAFSASSEILNFENRTIIKEDTDKNVSEGEIQVVDLCPSWNLRTSAS